MRILVCLVFFIASVSCACDSGCYHSVNNTNKNLVDLITIFNSTTSQAEISKFDLNTLKKDIQDVRNIENEAKKIRKSLEVSRDKLNDTEVTTSKNQKIVDGVLEKLANISLYNATGSKILKEGRDHLENLEKSLDLAQNASQTCQKAHQKYTEFKKIIEDLVKDYHDLTKSYNGVSTKAKAMNTALKDTFRNTLKDKEELEELEIPSSAVDGYVLDAEENLNRIVNRLKEDVNLLKELLQGSQEKWNKQLDAKWNEVVQNIKKVQNDVDSMNEELAKYEKAFISTDGFKPTVNDESRELLKQIKKKLEDLESKLTLMDFTEDEKDLLNHYEDDEKNIAELRRKRLLLKEYSTILDAVPHTEEKIKEITKQITDLRITISFVQEWEKLSDELGRLRRNRDEILKINCTTVGGSGLLQ